MAASAVSPSRKWSVGSVVGALIASFMASLCCIGPLVLALLGIGGAGLLVKLERYRPYFIVLTLSLLAVGFYFTYRKPKGVEGDACGCEHPKASRVGRVMLWIATIIVAAFLSFPYLAAKLF